MTDTLTAVYVAADLDVDYDGDEVLVFNVYVGDDDAEPCGTVYTVRDSGTLAGALADRMGRDRGLEVVVE